ncbi:ZnF_C2H2 [Nesidiocoris tenuis]|uniref:ZnF_C2H2 n=1 Tax=Nesidiocoris tenuis TaxID=355587 RepID=A0ABN7BCY3_9HEMI|nr:ZnF_C2H2 [Nesidiocoris tenuis]
MSENEYRYPDSSSPGSDAGSNSENKPEIRRGRPKAAMITYLMTEGATSQSGIRCEVCSRVFPRDKSLQAHRRVHTGERPYSCDFPGCLRKFKQSGQLKTHQRLHTGERPFICSVEGCTSRFTHANRHCSNHPQASLIRSEDTNILFVESFADSNEARQWLAKYRAEKETKSVEKRDPLATPVSAKGCLDLLTPEPEEQRDINAYTNIDRELADMTNFSNANPTHPNPGGTTNSAWSPIKSPLRLSPVKTPRISTPDRSRPVKSLFLTDATTLTVSPRKRELPKKRWLRIASRELASYASVSPTLTANLNRPTVLRHAAEFTSPNYVTSSSSFATPMAVPQMLQNLLTPPYSDEKQRHYEEDEELAVPLPSSEADNAQWCSSELSH